jgi:hypothetical protein
MKTRTAVSTLTLAAAALLAIPAYSQPGNGNGNGNGKGPPQGKGPASAQSADQGRGNAGNNGKSHSNSPGQGNRPGSGGGRGNGYADGRSGATLSLQFSFNDQQRSYLRDYYGNQFRTGNCPPGLAKKNNGCMPPGQAKKWRIGYPLGSDVIFYDLPGAVLAQLGPAPRGYRYARVADDILMLAVGTGLVVDAVASLSQ